MVYFHQFVRAQTTPVIAKGATYDGVFADALAAIAYCWDGTRFVATVSVWNTAAGKWYSIFLTSADLVTWAYVTGSLRSPSGGNVILGNGGIAWFGGKYWFAYNEYGGAADVLISHSTDLLTWTDLGAIVPRTTGEDASQYDPHLVVNPYSGLLECWFVGSNNRKVLMADSPDGSTWTARGVFLDGALPFDQDFGEPSAFYPGDGSRCLICDGGVDSGHRHTFLFRSAARDTTWVVGGSINGPSTVNAWENVQTFDGACDAVYDLGDGPRVYMLYAGSDVVSATDNTDSSIGLAYHAATPSGVAYTETGSGSVTLGSSGIAVLATHPSIGSGGTALGQSGTVSASNVLVTSGGAILGSSGIAFQSQALIGSGTMVTGSLGVVVAVMHSTGNGGIVMEGTGILVGGNTYTNVGSGDVSLGGFGMSVVSMAFTGSGGASIVSLGNPSASYFSVGSGLVVVEGTGVVTIVASASSGLALASLVRGGLALGA